MEIHPRRALIGALGVLLLVPSTLGAQAASPTTRTRPLSLAEARTMARRHSAELRAAGYAVEAAKGRERQAGAFPNPTVSYSREQTSRTGHSNAQDIVSVDQPLDFTGQRGARQDAASLLRAAADARQAGTGAWIDYDVARSYAIAVAGERRAALAEGAAEAFGRAVRVSQARLASGDVSGYQNRRLALEAGRYSALRLDALVARDSALRTLASLIGLADSAVPLLLTDSLIPAPLGAPVDSLVALALERRPELRAALLEASAGAAGTRLARAERIPIPTVTGGYKRERLADGEALGGFVLGLSLPLPVWDRRGGAVAAARGEAARREAESETLRRQTIRDVRTAYESHQALGAQLEMLSAQLGGDSASARRAAEVAYAEGEIGLLEWLDSVRAYQEAESVHATLRAELIARRAALERATGATLF